MSRSENVLGAEVLNELKSKHVAVVGVGGTGVHVAQLLGRMGISLTLIDRDIVERSNLERQVMYRKKDVDLPKVEAARRMLKEFCNVSIAFEDLHSGNINSVLGAEFDLLVDCTDNNDTRLLINDYCKKHGKAWIYSGGIEKIGSFGLFKPDGVCFACSHDEKYGESCVSAGVLNTTVSIVGSLVAQLAVDYLCEKEIENTLFRLNLERYALTQIKLKKNNSCDACNGDYRYLRTGSKMMKACSDGTYTMTIKKEFDFDAVVAHLPGKNTGYFLKNDDIMLMRNGRVVIQANTLTEAKRKYNDMIGI